jgi:hypothetical protein
MCAQVINSGGRKPGSGEDEEANSTVQVDATPTETMPAPEQPHATPADAKSNVFDPAALQDEPGSIHELEQSENDQAVLPDFLELGSLPESESGEATLQDFSELSSLSKSYSGLLGLSEVSV